jgi:hypothetical protein
LTSNHPLSDKLRRKKVTARVRREEDENRRKVFVNDLESHFRVMYLGLMARHSN